MRRARWPALVALMALAVRPGAAQERLPVPQPVPSPTPEAAPASLSALPPGCGVKVLWLEHSVPVTRLVPREVITEERRPSLEVAYREEKRVITEMIVKSREVEKQVPCTVMMPVTETCPETGECKTVYKPCTDIRTVKETEFYTVPEQRTLIVRVPYVKPAEIVVVRKAIVAEYRTILQKKEQPVVLPGPEGRPDRWILAPKVCPTDEVLTLPAQPETGK
jgi:hypothetical protein